MNPTSMAGWVTSNTKMNLKALDGNDMFMGLTKSAGLDLIQNCDLPPPMKVFTGSSDKTVISSINRICSMMSQEDHENSREVFDTGSGETGDGDEKYGKLELLKALRLSQTRAREAEKKAEKLAKEKECLSTALLSEARQLFVYRQWVRLLELEVSKLHSQLAEQEECGGCETWILAFCLGIAGVGFAFGRRYLY